MKPQVVFLFLNAPSAAFFVQSKLKLALHGGRAKAKRENSNSKDNDICCVCRKVNRIFSYEAKIQGWIFASGNRRK